MWLWLWRSRFIVGDGRGGRGVAYCIWVGVVVAGPTVTLIRVWGVLISKEAKMGFLEITHTHSLRECETFQSQRNGFLVWFLFIFFNFQFVERERFGRFWVE